MKNLIKGLTIISFMFVLSMMFGVVNVSALTSGDYEYTVNEDGNTVTINNYIGTSKNVTIPDKIDGKIVNIIGEEAFYEKYIDAVTIPNTVTRIDLYAFCYNNLSNIIIPNSVTIIGDDAFSGNQLTSVTIPNSVTTIGMGAFFNNKLTSVTIPNSVIEIREMAFQNNQLTSVVIPKSVKKIGFNAFAENVTLTKAVILNDSADMTIGDGDYDVFQEVSSSFKLYGYANSSVETYAAKANENGVSTEFVELKKITSSMISSIVTQYYKGSTLTPAIKVNDGTKDLELETDYEVTYKDNDKVGTATVIITGTDVYTGSVIEKTFEIKKQQYLVSINPLTGATITPSDIIDVDYDGSQNYTIKANNGYKITSILVDGIEMLSSLNDDVLTISNPTKDMSIEVKPEEVKEEITDTDTSTDTVVDDVKEDNPKTFDGILIYIGIAVLSLVGLTGTLVYKNKRKFN